MGARLCVCVFATIRATQTGLLTLLRPFRPPPYSGIHQPLQSGRARGWVRASRRTDRGVSRVGGGRAWGAWWGVASRAIPMRHGYPLIARKGRAGARASPRGSLVIGVLLKVLRWRTRPWRHPTYEGWCVVIPQPGQSALNPIRRRSRVYITAATATGVAVAGSEEYSTNYVYISRASALYGAPRGAKNSRPAR